MGTEFALPLEKVFEGRVFSVPDYQRGYAWTSANWDDLLDDLDLLDEGRDHYTGTIVLHRRGGTHLDETGRSYISVDVVDGQQRLTTLVLLLASIRRELSRLDPASALPAGIEAAYIRGRRSSGEPLNRLTLGTDTNHYWLEVALADEPAAHPAEILSHKRLMEARRHFETYLAGMKESHGDNYPTFLAALFDKVAHRLKIIPYEVDDAADVGVIFEVMNDRGRPLSELEKVKNYLLYLATKLSEPGGLSDQVNAAWSSMLRRLMQAELGRSGDEDQLLRNHWLMAYAPAPRDWEGTASIKKRLGLKLYKDRRPDLLAELRNYVSVLEAASIAYCDIQSPSRVDSFALAVLDVKSRRRLVEASERLLRLRVVATFLPVLMAARIKYPADVDGYVTLVDACERYAFRVYRVLESRADRGYSQMCRYGFDLFSGSASMSVTVDRIRSTALGYCPPATFEERLHAERNWYGWTGLRYLLYEYEYHLAGTKAVQVSWELLAKRDLERSVEHILPQTATGRYWVERFHKDDRERWTHDIGNLCLTQDNSSYGNRSFPDKRGSHGQVDAEDHLTRCYANSSLLQERELANLDDWTTESVESRREKVLSWAAHRWSIDVPAITPIEASAEDDEDVG